MSWLQCGRLCHPLPRARHAPVWSPVEVGRQYERARLGDEELLGEDEDKGETSRVSCKSATVAATPVGLVMSVFQTACRRDAFKQSLLTDVRVSSPFGAGRLCRSSLAASPCIGHIPYTYPALRAPPLFKDRYRQGKELFVPNRKRLGLATVLDVGLAATVACVSGAVRNRVAPR